MENNDNLSFEDYIKKLEEILVKLDDKNTSLENAVKNYTLGLEISKKCYNILNSSEELIVKKMTEAGLVDFNRE